MLLKLKWHNGELYLKPENHAIYSHYTAFSQLKRPDYPINNGSKGYATMQALLKSGWKYSTQITIEGATKRITWLDIAERDHYFIENFDTNFQDVMPVVDVLPIDHNWIKECDGVVYNYRYFEDHNSHFLEIKLLD